MTWRARVEMEYAGAMSVLPLIKPVGASCNLRCRYCYYLDDERRIPARHHGRMASDILEALVRAVIAAQPEGDITFSWQGGEPTLLGQDFFRDAIAMQQRWRPPGRVIRNTVMTNGTLLDAGWARFFKEHDVLVGLSFDGPPAQHDAYRRDVRGAPTAEAVQRGLALLLEHGVEVNTLTVVHARNWRNGRDVYRFLRRQGVRHMQFIPLVERRGGDGALAAPGSAGVVTPESVPAHGYGAFLSAVFDEWKRRDVGRVFVRDFEVFLGLWIGLPAGLCTFAPTCGRNPAVESTGDVYACDHYVYPEHRLGHIAEASLTTLVEQDQQIRFGEAKRTGLSDACRGCRLLPVCNGGCPKHRFVAQPAGRPGNHLCPSYRQFLLHAAPGLRALAAVLLRGRPASEAMALMR